MDHHDTSLETTLRKTADRRVGSASSVRYASVGNSGTTSPVRRCVARCCLTLCSFTVLVSACADREDAGKRPLGAEASAASALPDGAVTGTLVEQIPASPYVYLRLKTASGDVWAAVTEAQLVIGAPVTVYGAMVMQNFESKSLNRTFDAIYFGALEAPGGQSAVSGASAASVGTPPAPDAGVGPVEKARGDNARTIAEVWSQLDELTGKPVSIRGVVVKYNPGVMGKNWIHLQDGTGAATNGTHDITVTSLDDVTLGTTVTITGTVSVNRDFGAGYSYRAIIEDAKVAMK